MDNQTPAEQIWQKKRSSRRWLVILVMLVIVGVAIWAVRSAPVSLKLKLFASQPGLYPVTYVDDGDTIKVRINGKEETIRLIGVDTPEVKDPRKPVQCFGAEASTYTKRTLTGTSVRLQPDPQDSDRDKYQRLLRYVYLPDGTLYNAKLIQEGYGFAYVVFPYTKLNEFKQLEAQAHDSNVGLWSACSVDSTSIIKQTAAVR